MTTNRRREPARSLAVFTLAMRWPAGASIFRRRGRRDGKPQGWLAGCAPVTAPGWRTGRGGPGRLRREEGSYKQHRRSYGSRRRFRPREDVREASPRPGLALDSLLAFQLSPRPLLVHHPGRAAVGRPSTDDRVGRAADPRPRHAGVRPGRRRRAVGPGRGWAPAGPPLSVPRPAG